MPMEGIREHPPVRAETKPLPNPIHVSPTARFCVILALLYLLADLTLNRFALGNGWTILWPLNGVSIGLLVMRSRSLRSWGPVMLSIAVGTGIGEYLDDNGVVLTVLQRLISALEVILCAALLPRFTRLDLWLRVPHLSLRFCVAIVAGPGLTGLLWAWLAHLTLHEQFLAAYNGWATADALGIAATLPLVLSVGTPEFRALLRWRTLPRTLGALALAFATTALIFSVDRYPLLFLLFPVLLLVDLMLTFVGASVAALGVCLLAVHMTVHHPGTLAGWFPINESERNFALQAYLGFHLLALLPASIVLLERRWMTDLLEQANSQLSLLASMDGLTGIANRRTFDERCATEWIAAQRNKTGLALIMVDIDRFKLYNDQYGHLGGDSCLQTVARILVDASNRPRDLPARYGGEEFVMLLPDTTLEGAWQLAEAVRLDVFNRNISHSGAKQGRLTLSLGCAAISPKQGESVTMLLELADMALYDAKQRGRNEVCSRSMEDQATTTFAPLARQASSA